MPGAKSRSLAIRKRLISLCRIAIGVTILGYLAHSGQINLFSLARLFHVWPITLISVTFLLLDILLMSIRVSLLFRNAKLSLGLGHSFQLNLIGFFFSTFLPGAAGGDIAKLVYATKENQGRRAEVATVLILDRLIGLFSLVLLPLLFAPFFPDLLRSVPLLTRLLYLDGLLAGSMLFGTALALFFPPVRNWVAFGLGRWPRIKSLALRVMEAMAKHGDARDTLLFAIILSLLANLALITVTGLGLYVVRPDSFSMKLALVAPLGHLANSLPLTPGGIGVGETAFNKLFAAARMSGGAETLLCFRLWTILVGFLGLVVYLFGMDNRIVHPYEQRSEQGNPDMSVPNPALDWNSGR